MPLPTAPMITRRSALAAAAAALAWRPGFAAGAPTDAAEALHVLNRLAFGPAPGDLDRVTQMGAGAWIAEQLRPESLALPAALAQQLGALETPRESQRDLVKRYREAEQAAKRRLEKRALIIAAVVGTVFTVWLVMGMVASDEKFDRGQKIQVPATIVVPKKN